MKKTVVSFADEAGSYRKSMKRLKNSLFDNGFDGCFVGYQSYEEIGSPPHKGPGSVPYAFKAYAIKKAIEEGGDGLYLWCDSPIYATKSISPVFEHIKRHGYLFFDNIGYSISDYTSDACLKNWHMTRYAASNKKMIMACVYGVDTKNEQADKFLQLYISAASDGISYQGDWFNNQLQISSDAACKGHRHDQSVASLIIANEGLKITNAQQTFFAYESHKGVLPISGSVCLWSGGI